MQWFVFGEDWNSHPSSTQHLFKRIVQEDSVVWVNSIGLRSPKINHKDAKRVIQKAKSLFKAESLAAPKTPDNIEPTLRDSHIPQSLDHTLFEQTLFNQKGLAQEPIDIKPVTIKPVTIKPIVIEPHVLPFHQSHLVRRINKYSLKRQLENATKHLSERETARDEPRVLWLSLPSAVDLIGHCHEDVSVYYCGDDFSALAGVDHKTIARMEQELIQECDLIFTASQTLKDKFPPEKTHLLEHGVDYELFQTPHPKPPNFPEGKVMGFYGQLADWVDIPLLESIVETFSDWTLMIIGDIHTNTGKLLNHKNVCHLSAMPHNQLAAYAQHWDIALLPFKHCSQIFHCNPLKLREYLATGTQIISTDFPAAQPYQPHLDLVTEKDNFIDTIHKVIEKQNSFGQRQESLRQKAQQESVYIESWQQRVNLVNMLVRQTIQKKTLDDRICFSNTHS